MNLTFHKGIYEDTQLLIPFLEEIKAEMQEQDWFYLDSPDVIREMMTDGTMELWLTTDDTRLAAIFTILHPGLQSHNYGYDLDLSEEELQLVIHMDTAAVHRDYRGLGLQGKMVQMAEKELSGKGRKILLSTVHPENRFSLNNMLRLGYEIQKRVNKYGSERYILRKEIF